MKGFALVVVLGVSSASWAQSFNIDMDTPFSPPLGGGAPSDSFGGAAGTPGRWNSVPAAGFGTNLLVDLQGNPTGVRMIGPPGGGGGGHNIPINTGDYARLLNDAREFGHFVGLQFKFTGLSSGTYRIFTYAVNLTTQPIQRFSRVVIEEAVGPKEQYVWGPMPGNQVIEGITHSIHEVNVAHGEVNVYLQSVEPGTTSWFNGIQVKQVVPEPTSILGLGLGLLFARKKIKRVLMTE